MILIRIAIVLVCAALTGCVTTGAKSDSVSSDKGSADSGPGFFESKSGHALKVGLAQYSDGKFVEAAKELQSALDLGLSDSDQIKAHKHLAFIHCISGRKPACRAEFLKALDINPNLELEPAEAGHPIWGPVFKAAKVSKLKGDAKADAPATKPAKATKATKAKSSKTSDSN